MTLTTARILLISLVFMVALWLAGAAYEHLYFHANLRFMILTEPLSFGDALLFKVPPHALFYRVLFAVACLLGGVIVAGSGGRVLARDRARTGREAMLRAFIGALPDAGFVFDAQGRYMEVISPSEGLLVGEEEEKRGNRLHDLFRKETADRLLEVIRTTIRTGRPQTVAYDVRTEDGLLRFEGRTAPAPQSEADGRPLVVWVARDVTARAQLEEQVRQTEKLQAIGQLAGGVAHDFNNQLGGIMGFADLLSRDLDDPRLSGYAEKIVKSSRRAADLTQQLLAFSRKGKHLSVPVDAHLSIEEVRGLLGRSIDKRIRIRTDLRADPAAVNGDPSQLHSALLNLGLNARDAMPDGGELVFATERVEPDEELLRAEAWDLSPGPHVRITVSDTGVGMDAETQRRMFDPFFTTKGQGRGTGMGLAAVYGTVKMHGGAIRVRSAPGEGTSVEIYLPAAEAPAQKEAIVPEVETQGQGGRVLVVDDEEPIRFIASEMLKSLGYTVVAEPDGKAAVDRFEREHESVDVVLLDMVMPELSGPDTFHALRGIDPDARVILSSGYSVSGETEALLRDGARGFVQKPYRIADLGVAIRAALE